MNTTELVNKKVSLLPQEIQLQVLYFVNFLAKKYEVDDDEFLLKQFLLQREAQVKKEERVSFKDLKLKFKFNRVTKMVDEIWDEKGWTEETMNEFLNTHMRTPYRK